MKDINKKIYKKGDFFILHFFNISDIVNKTPGIVI
jgi:hypothetical protein